MPTHRPHGRASNTQGHIPYTHRHKQVLKGTQGHIHRPCAWNTRAHTTAHTDVHTQSHFVRSKGNDTVSPHPHRTTHKHANRSTHTGGCCVAPTSTCGVFSFCLFWERKTNRFSSPQPLGATAPQPPADVQGAAPSPPVCPDILHLACGSLQTPNLPFSEGGTRFLAVCEHVDGDFEAYKQRHKGSTIS